MNILIKILIYIAKLINGWVLVFPCNYNVIATIINLGIIYLIFGTMSLSDLRYGVLEGRWFAQALVFVFLGLPAFSGFFYFLSQYNSTVGDSIDSHLDSVLAHRNNMMNNSSPKEAYEIMRKTSNLDVMKSSPAFRHAKMGFNATSGRDSPSKVYNGLMGKKD